MPSPTIMTVLPWALFLPLLPPYPLAHPGVIFRNTQLLTGSAWAAFPVTCHHDDVLEPVRRRASMTSTAS